MRIEIICGIYGIVGEILYIMPDAAFAAVLLYSKKIRVTT